MTFTVEQRTRVLSLIESIDEPGDLRPLFSHPDLMADSLRALLAAYDEAVADAERYRWLRSQVGLTGCAMVDILRPGDDWNNTLSPRNPESLDAAIDAIMHSKPSEPIHVAEDVYSGKETK